MDFDRLAKEFSNGIRIAINQYENGEISARELLEYAQQQSASILSMEE